ncbi:MAG: hypothetical protein AAF564_20995 [Bacteroidota bacterium]
MKLLRLFFSIVVVTILVWIVVWLLMGQDLNLFARMVLPIPIVVTVVASALIAGLLAGLHRMASGHWMAAFPNLMWSTWTFVTIGFILLIVATTG